LSLEYEVNHLVLAVQSPKELSACTTAAGFMASVLAKSVFELEQSKSTADANPPDANLQIDDRFVLWSSRPVSASRLAC
jgi:hypothetical protein